MTTWKITELRGALKASIDTESFEHARRLLRSLQWKIDAEKYHTRIAEEAFAEHFGSTDISVDEAARLALSRTENGAKFDYCVTVREFNIVASAAASHSIPELFAQLIAILFLPRKINVHDITFGKVIAELPNGNIKEKLVEIKNSSEYNYLSAFINMTKHISLVIPEYHISFEDDEYHGVRFKEFEFRRASYPAKLDRELLSEIRTMRRLFIDLGILINNAFLNSNEEF